MQARALFLGASLIASGTSLGHEVCDGNSEQTREAGTAQITQIIGAVQHGWEHGDGTPFREHFLDFPQARYIETGGQNEGLDDLVLNHVEPEGDALEWLKLSYDGIETWFEGPIAWAVTDVRVQAKIRKDGREIDKKGHGTWIFRCVDGEWKVIHTHSSTRDRKR